MFFHTENKHKLQKDIAYLKIYSIIIPQMEYLCFVLRKFDAKLKMNIDFLIVYDIMNKAMLK